MSRKQIHRVFILAQETCLCSDDQPHLVLAPDYLDNLEDGRSADQEEEKGQDPWTNWILFSAALGALRDIASEHNILRGLLVGNLHFLCSGHGELVSGCK